MAVSLATERAQPVATATRRGSSILTQVLVLTTKSLRALVMDPRMVVASLLGPFLMLLVFSQIFASVATMPNFPQKISYTDFLVPAIMVNTILQSASQSGAKLVEDMKNGIVARFRSLPIWLGSVLLAHSLIDLVRSALQQLFLLAIAFAFFGFRPAGGVLGVLAAWGLALVVGNGLGWIFIALACWVRNAELMQSIATMVMFPLIFASNAFVPVTGLPRWLQTVARLNPLSHGIDAARNLALAHPVGGSAIAAVAISLAIATMATAIAIRGFHRPM